MCDILHLIFHETEKCKKLSEMSFYPLKVASHPMCHPTSQSYMKVKNAGIVWNAFHALKVAGHPSWNCVCVENCMKQIFMYSKWQVILSRVIGWLSHMRIYLISGNTWISIIIKNYQLLSTASALPFELLVVSVSQSFPMWF